jgi:group I intron endonuclease
MTYPELEDAWVVYKITLLTDGRSYFGCTCHETLRLKQHYHSRNSSNTRLSQAMRENQLENFVFEVVARCNSRKEANLTEAALIRAHNTIWPKGFNLQKGGLGSLKANLSEETRAKLSAAVKLVTASEDGMRAHMERVYRSWSGERGESRRQRLRDRWSDPEFKANALRGIHRALDTRWNGADSESQKAAAAQLLADRNRANWQRPEYAAKMKARLSEQTISPEMRQRISATLVQHFADNPPPPASAETRAKLSAAITAHYARNPPPPNSPELRAKKSTGMKMSWAARKAAKVTA